MKNNMRISFIALVVSPVLAHKHALLEWIGGEFIWDSKTEPYMATQVNQIDILTKMFVEMSAVSP